MGRAIAYLYGVACYVLFLGTFLYAIGFVGNFVVPKSIDSGLPEPFGMSLIINAVLLGIFAVQHSLMARPYFKRWLTQFIPASAERSTYVLFSSVALLVLYVAWQPIGGVIWETALGANPLGSGSVNPNGILAYAATDWSGGSGNGVYLVDAATGVVRRVLHDVGNFPEFAQPVFAAGRLLAADTDALVAWTP